MATDKAKGSILLEISIVVLAAALIATILYPKMVWQEAEKDTQTCRANMDRILKAELVYMTYHNTYEDTLDKAFSFIENDTTGEIIMSYVNTDTVLAKQLLASLTSKYKDADDIIQNHLADTLLFTVLETTKYDSNLAKVILRRYDAIPPMADSLQLLRGLDSSSVWMFKKLSEEFSGLQLITPLREDDSLKLVMQRYDPEIPVGALVDTLYKNPVWAASVDSAVNATLASIHNCPTTGETYKISVDDTTVIKKISIYCPLDSTDIEAAKKDFIKYHLGHLRLHNHGAIVEGEKNWLQ
ncbi:hypothetical protein JW960_04805 [candidate division KSB1 bacterium]|nr:hypothetical protein [candidate division KSB1 bacterium]